MGEHLVPRDHVDADAGNVDVVGCFSLHGLHGPLVGGQDLVEDDEVLDLKVYGVLRGDDRRILGVDGRVGLRRPLEERRPLDAPMEAHGELHLGREKSVGRLLSRERPEQVGLRVEGPDSVEPEPVHLVGRLCLVGRLQTLHRSEEGGGQR